MRGPARFATYIGRILMFVGFLMIVIAWDGAASLDFIQGQFPYLLSGGVPGLALIVVGAGLEYIQATRQMTAERAKQMAELNLSVVKLVGFMKDPATTTAPALPEKAPEAAIPATVGATSTGQMPSSAYAPAPETSSDDTADQPVIAGRSSFHAPTCHLVSGRDDMAAITRLEAEGQGLSPCRVCKP